MSQSDYIRFKKTANVLKNKLPALLDPADYTSFATYNLETSVTNRKNSYSRLLPTADKSFFNIEKKVSNCPNFIMCKNTNNRPNRVLNTAEKIINNGTVIPYSPAPTKRIQKTTTTSTCKFINANVLRTAPCTKRECKCGTTVISAY